MANENRAGKLAAEMTAISATIDKPILLSTYTTASPAAIATLAGGRHPLLHRDAELRPRDPGARRLRRLPGAPRASLGRTRYSAGGAR